MPVPAEWLEAWRTAYTPWLLQPEPGRPQLIAVTSAHDGEGKTTTSLGLALTVAGDLGRSVLLMDCNLFMPRVSEAAGIEEAVGVANWLGLSHWAAGDVDVDSIILRTALDNLWLIPCGPAVANPSRLIRSGMLSQLMSAVRAKFDVIIMDAPSLFSSADTRVLVTAADAVVLVVRAGATSTRALDKALRMTDDVPNRGIVVNAFHSAIPSALQRLLMGR